MLIDSSHPLISGTAPSEDEGDDGGVFAVDWAGGFEPIHHHQASDGIITGHMRDGDDVRYAAKEGEYGRSLGAGWWWIDSRELSRV